MSKKKKKLKGLTNKEKEKLSQKKSPKTAISIDQKPSVYPRKKLRIIISLFALTILFYLIINKEFIIELDKIGKFNLSIPNDSLSYKVTSPLCGCYDQSIKHYGLLSYPEKIFLDSDFGSPQVNYLITAPSFSSISPNEDYSFESTYYGYSSNLGKNKIEVIKKIPHSFFLSIITTEHLEIDPIGIRTGVAFLPPINSQVTYSAIKGKDFLENQGTEINSEFRINTPDIENIPTEPMVDLLGDSIEISWYGQPQILTPFGRINNLNKLDDYLKTEVIFNRLVIKPPFSLRISPQWWEKKCESFWINNFIQNYCSRYFKNGTVVKLGAFSDTGIFFENSDGKIYDIKPNDFVTYDIPHYFPDSTGTGRIELSLVAQSNDKYNKTFSVITNNALIPVKYPKGTKQHFKAFNAREDIANQFLNAIGNNDRWEYLVKKRLHTLPKNAIGVERTSLVENYEFIFRLPHITEHQGLTIYLPFKEATFFESEGFVLVNNTRKEVVSGDINIQNDLYFDTYLPFFISYDNTKVNPLPLKAKMTGKLKLNGKVINVTLAESKFVDNVLASIAIIELIIIIVALIFWKRKYPESGIF